MKKLLKTMLVLVMSFALVFQFPVNVHAEDETIASVELVCYETTLLLNSNYDDYIYAYVNINPWFADYESVEWDLSEDGIVSLEVDEDDWARLKAESEGSVTLTVIVTGKSGAVFTDSCEITVEEATAIESVEIEDLELTAGESSYPTVNVQPDNYPYYIADCSSSDESVATVDWDGEVYGISAGTATITVWIYDYAIADYIETTFEVTVLPATALESFEIDESVTTYTGEDYYIWEYPDPYNAYYEVEWKTSDESIVTVDEWGEIYGVSEGTATITATATDSYGNTFTDTCEVTVLTAPALESFEIDETITGYVGYYVYIEEYPSSYHANYEVEWILSDESVVTVDEWGDIYGVGEGTATVTATATDSYGNTFTNTCEVTILPIPALESFEIDETITGYVGYYNYIDEYPSSYYADYEVEWSSSDNSVVMINDWGIIYGVSEGTATVTATATDSYGHTFTDTCEVTVKEMTAIESIELEDMVLTVGDSSYPTVNVEPDNVLYFIDYCSSSDESVAYVDWDGEVYGLSEGTATITIWIYDYYTDDYIKTTFDVTVSSTECSHIWDDGEVTVEPTCTDTGVMTYTCTECGETYTSIIPVTDHSYDEGVVTVAPTCTEKGVMTYTCTTCGDTRTEVIEATGHSYGEGVVTKEATHLENGIMTYTCTVCGKTYTEDIPALDHTWDEGVIAKEATCTEDGEITYTCTEDDATYTEVIPATGHSYESVVTVAPTCIEKGVMTYTCSVCDDTYTEEIPATGHSYDEGVVTVEATCIETGVMTYTCSVCGDTYTAEIPATGHNYVGVVTTEPTETTEGVITYTCASCGDTYTKAIPSINESNLSTLTSDYDKISNDKNEYTPSSYNALASAIEEAKKVLNNEESTQEEIATALANLQKAYEALTKTTVESTVTDTEETSSVQTSDDSNIALYAGLVLVSLLGVALFVENKKRLNK